jgi:tetratricopeptide (TPR) repeat protein
VPKVFISYSHDSQAHNDRILELSDRLRAGGVDCVIDQYEQFPAERWPRWCAKRIKESNFVLVACTETYLRRFEGEEEPGIGLGGTWEGHIITQELYDAQGRNSKFVPIIFSKDDGPFIPTPLQGAMHYQLPHNYDGLYRLLTSQPSTPMPTIGSIKPMPARERKQDFQMIWHMPYARNPFFTGRESILGSLHDALEQQKSAAISGVGGMGKTQTAIEYAYRHRSQYKAVLWAKAEALDTLLADYVSIARTLGLPSREAKEQELAVAEVRNWLETNSGWLLILDNADDLALLKDFLPHDYKGHLLLTTRAHAVAGLAERLPITSMEPEEGALLLLRRAKLGQADQSLAVQISKELGGLPLALDQAGAFIEETPCTPAEYLEIYVSEKDKLLAERGSLGDHPSVAVTFSLAFDKVAANSAAAADLIRLCAFLAPDAIPEEIITEGADVLGEHLGSAARSPFDFAKALREAGRYSLLLRDAQNKTLDIHRLVQVVIQAGMPDEDQRLWAERAVRAVQMVFPFVEFKSWGSCQKLLPHAQACANLIDRCKFDFVEAAALLNQAGLYLCERGPLAEAEQFYKRALALYEKAQGPHHPYAAAILNNLATLYLRQGRYGKAEPFLLCKPFYQRALALYEKAQEPDHPYAAILNNLAALYLSQGRYGKAEPLLRRTLAIWEMAVGPDHPHVATSLNNLAVLFDNQGEYAKAQPLYRRALTICEKALGPDHPQVATTLHNLAGVYCNQGQYTEAEPLHRRALAIYEKAFGPDHPSVATSLYNLADIYSSQGRDAEGEPLRQRARAFREKPR